MIGITLIVLKNTLYIHNCIIFITLVNNIKLESPSSANKHPIPTSSRNQKKKKKKRKKNFIRQQTKRWYIPAAPKTTRWYSLKQKKSDEISCSDFKTSRQKKISLLIISKLIASIYLQEELPTRHDSSQLNASKKSTGKFTVKTVCFLRRWCQPMPQHSGS